MRRGQRAFTLVELAVTVVIIGILAVIAIVAYRRKIAATRVTEATNMITTIRRGQEEYKAEKGVYANVSNSITAFYPNASPGPKVTQWGAPCTTCPDPNGWEQIKVHADGPVLFGYATTAGVGAGPISNVGSSMAAASFGSSGGGSSGGGPGANVQTGEKAIDDVIASQTAIVKPTDPVFVALAKGDYDGDGKKCHVLGISHTNNIVVSNEGD